MQHLYYHEYFLLILHHYLQHLLAILNLDHLQFQLVGCLLNYLLKLLKIIIFKQFNRNYKNKCYALLYKFGFLN